MVKHWKPYEEALSEVEAKLAEMLPDDTRRLANLEQLANRQLQHWLADGLIDSSAWQLLWQRGQGAFGAGSLGLHFPDGETGQGEMNQQTYAPKLIDIPSYWWRIWLSSDDASRDLFHYAHYRGSRRGPDGQGVEWIGPRFIATAAKLSTSGIGECWRVVQINQAQFKTLISSQFSVAALEGPAEIPKRPRGRPPKARWEDIKGRVFASCRTDGRIGARAPSPDELRVLIERDPDFPTDGNGPAPDTIRTEYAQPWANELKNLQPVD